MSPFPLRLHEQAMASARVYHLRFYDDLSITDEFTDVGAGVGGLYFGLLGWVKPNLALADPRNGGGETFLHAEIH